MPEPQARKQPRAPASTQPRAPVSRVVRLFRPYRWAVAVTGVISVLSALLALVAPLLLRDVLDVAIPRGDRGLLAALCLTMLVSHTLSIALGVWQTYLTNRVGQRILHDLRTSVYRRLQAMSVGFFTSVRGGEVQSRLVNDIGAVNTTVTSTAAIALNATTAAVTTLVALVVLSWPLTLATLAIMAVYAVLNVRVTRQRRRLTLARQDTMAELTGQVEESLSVNGVLLGRATNRQNDLVRRYEGDSFRLAELEQRQRMAGRWLRALVQLVFTAIPVLIYWYAGDRQATGDRSLSLGTIVAFATMQSRLLPPMVALLSLNTSTAVALTLFGRIFQYLDLRPDVVAGTRALPPGPNSPYALALRGVCFAYPGRRVWALAGIDLDVPHGTHVAVVGTTGSGKTTLGYLLARHYDPQYGRIYADGVDLRELSGASLTGFLGFVPQDPFLLHDTVANNLRFAARDAPDDQLWAALAVAGVAERIRDSPHGLSTVVGSRGYRFSGGEKQRLALARALLQRTPVLVLDEATSALDPETEEQVYDNLRAALVGTTLITITHRADLAERADLTVVMAGGRVSRIYEGRQVSRHVRDHHRHASSTMEDTAGHREDGHAGFTAGRPQGPARTANRG